MDIKPADFKGFFNALSPEAQASFAQRAGSTVSNIRVHWVSGRKVPKGAPAMERLYEACRYHGAGFSKPELVWFFYASPDERLVA